ncbi:M48 family metallopeptidase [bacterium]|nr:M48 family metallopeptidase [bacterium]
MKFKLSVILMSLVLLTSCSTKVGQKMGLSEPTDDEINSVAVKAYEDIKKKEKISKNKRLTKMVERVAFRVAKASGENFNWEVILIEKDEPNAWCMPGGKMAVYTGILPILKTEGALAAVMGHEVAHATKKHGKQRYARAVRGQMVGMGIGLAAIVGGQLLCKTQKCKMLSAIGGVAGAFAVTFFDRKFSRSDETEADQVGQIYMAKAGYDPAEAPKVWERMGAAGGKAPPEFLSTHPASGRRKENLRSWLPEANRYYQNAPQQYGTGENI